MSKSSDTLTNLPPAVDLETAPVLKALTTAHRALAELKGRAATIPNQSILVNTLTLQEAKASSAIENIVTTQDELFQAELSPENTQSAATKEVARYREALKLGFKRLEDSQGIISNNTLIKMFQLLKERSGGFRETPGTVLKDGRTGRTIYTPPQDANEIVALMTDLERFVNEDDACPLDPLTKMALIHHQFESIHPFPDGNGRVGRILNVLYLVRVGLLESPILYLSRYIIRTKNDYYHLLQAVRGNGDEADAWRKLVLYMLEGVAETACATLELVEGMREQTAAAKHRMRTEFPRMYSQDLLNNLFRHPYTRIEFVAEELDVTRHTAAKYLDALAGAGFVRKHRVGRNNYYINERLVQLFLDAAGESQ